MWCSMAGVDPGCRTVLARCVSPPYLFWSARGSPVYGSAHATASFPNYVCGVHARVSRDAGVVIGDSGGCVGAAVADGERGAERFGVFIDFDGDEHVWGGGGFGGACGAERGGKCGWVAGGFCGSGGDFKRGNWDGDGGEWDCITELGCGVGGDAFDNGDDRGGADDWGGGERAADVDDFAREHIDGADGWGWECDGEGDGGGRGGSCGDEWEREFF